MSGAVGPESEAIILHPTASQPAVRPNELDEKLIELSKAIKVAISSHDTSPVKRLHREIVKEFHVRPLEGIVLDNLDEAFPEVKGKRRVLEKLRGCALTAFGEKLPHIEHKYGVVTTSPQSFKALAKATDTPALVKVLKAVLRPLTALFEKIVAFMNPSEDVSARALNARLTQLHKNLEYVLPRISQERSQLAKDIEDLRQELSANLAEPVISSRKASEAERNKISRELKGYERRAFEKSAPVALDVALTRLGDLRERFDAYPRTNKEMERQYAKGTKKLNALLKQIDKAMVSRNTTALFNVTKEVFKVTSNPQLLFQ